MVSFYRKFLPGISQLTASISDLLRKDTREPLSFSDSNLDKFKNIKAIPTNKPLLRLPDKDRTFVLQSDASADGLGAVLTQYYDNCPFPVAYASRKLLDREKNYSTIEKECLAIVWAVQKFKYYLLGKEFILEIDHKPLIYLKKFRNENSRLMRWSLLLQPYRFRLVHIPGTSNCGADYLSRSSE